MSVAKNMRKHCHGTPPIHVLQRSEVNTVKGYSFLVASTAAILDRFHSPDHMRERE